VIPGHFARIPRPAKVLVAAPELGRPSYPRLGGGKIPIGIIESRAASCTGARGAALQLLDNAEFPQVAGVAHGARRRWRFLRS